MGGVKKHLLMMRKKAEMARECKRRKREGGKEQNGPATAPATTTPPQHPLHTPTCSAATKRKLEIHRASKSTKKMAVEDENIIFRKSYLQEVFSRVACSYCFGELKVGFTNKFMDYKIDLECEVCGNRMMDSEVKETPITAAMVYSTMDVGLGNVGFQNLTGNMSMRSILNHYAEFQSLVINCMKAKVKEVLNSSIEAAKRHYSADEDGIYDVKVIFDGSWQKRGHTSKLAVGAVVDAETGCVLDYETVSNYCEQCTKRENSVKLGELSEEQFGNWLSDHKSTCMKNYEGSSGGMEAAAAVKLFIRSLDNDMRYTVFISDGDSSAYTAVCALNNGKGPYDGVKVEKGECVNHVGRRLGTALRKVQEQVETEKKAKKGKVRRVKEMKGKGKLTDIVIGKLQKYYSAAIRRHVGGSVEELRKDIFASFLHCSSTDSNPQHHLCPKSTDSYCFYQRAIATNQPIPSHKNMKVSFVLSSELRQKVWGEYKRLTTDKILSACLLGKTQNVNEHLHSQIWHYYSKYKNANKNILDFCVAQAVLDYNVGYEEGFVLPLLGEPYTQIHQFYLKRRDWKRERVLSGKT